MSVVYEVMLSALPVHLHNRETDTNYSHQTLSTQDKKYSHVRRFSVVQPPFFCVSGNITEIYFIYLVFRDTCNHTQDFPTLM